jgi:hypothetical protein
MKAKIVVCLFLNQNQIGDKNYLQQFFFSKVTDINIIGIQLKRGGFVIFIIRPETARLRA